MDSPPSVSDRDRALVAAVLSATRGAFAELVQRYQGLCWHIINRMVRHPEDTRELCQETFLRVHRHLHQYRFESPLKSWIGQIAYSVAARHLKRKRIPLVEAAPELVEQIAEDRDPEAALSEASILADIHREIEKLPPLQRTILTMYHLDELTLAEIAVITGMPEGTLKSHLFRSRMRLGERLQRHRRQTAHE